MYLEHIRRDVVDCRYMRLIQIFLGMFLPKINKIGWHLTIIS